MRSKKEVQRTLRPVFAKLLQVIQVNPQLSARLLEFLAALLQRGILFVVLRPDDDDLASCSPLFFGYLGLFGGFTAEGEGAAGPTFAPLAIVSATNRST
jgi:hypothetical protein